MFLLFNDKNNASMFVMTKNKENQEVFDNLNTYLYTYMTHISRLDIHNTANTDGFIVVLWFCIMYDVSAI